MLKFYSPLTGDFYENDVDEFGWNNGTVDYPTLFTGSDMSYYLHFFLDPRHRSDPVRLGCGTGRSFLPEP